MADSAQHNREISSFAPTGTPPIDVTQLEEMLGPVETEEILDLFISSTEELLQRLHASVVSNQSKSLREGAHELKGACSSVGAHSMAQTCFELEQAARNEDWETAHRLQDGLVELFESARIYIKGRAA